VRAGAVGESGGGQWLRGSETFHMLEGTRDPTAVRIKHVKF
jgi:hypothetical protein